MPNRPSEGDTTPFKEIVGKNVETVTRRTAIAALLGLMLVGIINRCDSSAEPEKGPITLPSPPDITVAPVKNPILSASEARLTFKKKNMTCVNFQAPQNKHNRPRLENLGINLEPLKGLGSYKLFPNGEGAEQYEDFEKRVIEVLQPDSVVNIADPEQRHAMQVLGSSAILSAAAVGVFQILLQYHGDVLPGWDSPEKKNWGKNVDWAGNLKIIHRYMNDPDYQFTAAVALAGVLQKQYNGNIRKMAAVYSNNDGIANMSLQFLLDLIRKKKSYMGKVQKIFKEETGRNKVEDTPEDLKAFVRGIAFAETGTQ